MKEIGNSWGTCHPSWSSPRSYFLFPISYFLVPLLQHLAYAQEGVLLARRVRKHRFGGERRPRRVVALDVGERQRVCGGRHAAGVDLAQRLEVVEDDRELRLEARHVLFGHADARELGDVLDLVAGEGHGSMPRRGGWGANAVAAARLFSRELATKRPGRPRTPGRP